MPIPRIAALLEVHPNTVGNWLRDQAVDLEPTVKVAPALTVGGLIAMLEPAELESLGKALAGGGWDSRARKAAERRLGDLVG